MKVPNTEGCLTTPVLFIIFNRPETTRRVFEAIRKARPKQLFIVADGPRGNHPEEIAKCNEARKIATALDWDCELKTLFRENNRGCGKGVAEGITWFFSQVEEGIILEDDCLPSQDFFRFSTELLERYRNDTRVMQISGNSLSASRYDDGEYSYFFSNQNFIWGWATWRRSWQLFDFRMNYYDEVSRKRYHNKYFNSFDEQDYYKYVFDQMYSDIEHTTIWDYQWEFTRMLNAGLAIVPWHNLVVNVGYGKDATHTSNYQDIIPDLKLESMEFPLKHPEFMMAHREKDSLIFNNVFTTPWSRIKQRVKRFIPKKILDYRTKLLRS